MLSEIDLDTGREAGAVRRAAGECRARAGAAQHIGAETRITSEVGHPGRSGRELAVISRDRGRIDISEVRQRKIVLGGADAFGSLLRKREVPVPGERAVPVGRGQLDPAVDDKAVIERDGHDRRAELAEVDAIRCVFIVEVGAELEAAEQILGCSEKCTEEQLTAGSRAKNSDQVPNAHAIGSVGYDNLGMFTIIEMATEITDAVPPLHHIPGIPHATYLAL
jgi:hypothetical protein